MDINAREHDRKTFIKRVTAAMNDGGEETAAAGEVKVEADKTRGDVPDVCEGGAGEVASPTERRWHCTDVGEQLIATRLASVVAFVRFAPNALGRVRAVWLADDVMKKHLDDGRNYNKLLKLLCQLIMAHLHVV